MQLVSVFWCKTWCTMDIYYCDKCGKRIANQDILEKQPLNRTTDGMYCKQCRTVMSKPKADKLQVNEKKSAQFQVLANKARSSPPSGEFRPGAGHGVLRRRTGPAAAVKDKDKPAPAGQDLDEVQAFLDRGGGWRRDWPGRNRGAALFSRLSRRC